MSRRSKNTVWRWCAKCMDWHLVAHFDSKRETEKFIGQSVKLEHSTHFFDWGASVTITSGEKPTFEVKR